MGGATLAGTRRVRLVVDIAPDLRRRIKIAAAQRDVPIKNYVTEILEGIVPGGGIPMTRADVDHFRRVRDSIMAGRRFPDDSADILAEQRRLREKES